jgi:hypothetical protein
MNATSDRKLTHLWQLFIATAFPLHVWGFIIILMDISWVAERTHLWDAIGAAGYGLTVTLLESLLVFSVLLLVAFVLPKTLHERKRVVLLCWLFWIPTLWGMAGQLSAAQSWSLPEGIIRLLAGLEKPLWPLYGGLFFAILSTVSFGVYMAIFSQKFQAITLAALERISPLMGLYLTLDLIGVLIVLIRNIG